MRRREVERAKEKYERATETKEAQLKAEYTTDTVFSQKSVKDGFDSVSEVKKLTVREREGIARDLFFKKRPYFTSPPCIFYFIVLQYISQKMRVPFARRKGSITYGKVLFNNRDSIRIAQATHRKHL